MEAHAKEKETVKPIAPAPVFRFDEIKWTHMTAVGILHIGCLFAPFFFSWSAVIVAAVLYWVVGGLGVTLGYHRLLTHRSFETHPVIRYALTIFATMAYQGGPIQWVGNHRMHHKHSDTNEDPHSPKHGFAWGHMLWVVTKDHLRRDAKVFAKDLKREPGMVFINKYFYMPQVILGVILFLIGGWSWAIWGIAVRTVVAYHGTWLVNSASHTWGYRNFETNEGSTNNWWVAMVSWGEGWHNNHHAHQRSARHGMRWFEFDVTWLTIRFMKMVGLARKVYVPDVDFNSRPPAK